MTAVNSGRTDAASRRGKFKLSHEARARLLDTADLSRFNIDRPQKDMKTSRSRKDERRDRHSRSENRPRHDRGQTAREKRKHDS